MIKGGSGIYLEKYKKIKKKKKSKNIIMVSRILENKGIIEFTNKARRIIEKISRMEVYSYRYKIILSPDTIDDQIINYYVKIKL